MRDQLFLIAIGGAGMRCMEAFVHLCAIGMLDGRDVHILSVDTDANNGNKSRSEFVADTYIKVKGGQERQKALNQSFFSARLHLYRVGPNYTGSRRNLREISRIDQGEEKNTRKNNALAALLFDGNTEQFKLEHGYRAQTNLGSHLMYHYFLEEMRDFQAGRLAHSDLDRFLTKLLEADSLKKASVFIVGSIFGGTGASSIPVAPRALQDAIKIKDPNKSLSPDLLFGATLLTQYFKFRSPQDQQLAAEKIVADANNFALNSQAALMFYESDPTIKKLYQRMYLLGWPIDPLDYDKNQKNTQTVTGGAEQKNPAHVVELLAAFAAYDFFTSDIRTTERELLYRSVEFDAPKFRFDFTDFAGEGEDLLKFKNKLTALLGVCFLFNNDFNLRIETFIAQLSKYNIHDFDGADSVQLRALAEYIRLFAFGYENETVAKGWLWQVQESTGQDKFLFNENVFSTDARKLRDFNWGQIAAEEEHRFTKRGLFSTPPPYDPFMKVFKDAQADSIENGVEKLLNRLYKTFTTLHRITR